MPIETISHITIKGYKSIRGLENFELRRFNVLIGANGVGKSNFVDFFRMWSFMLKSTEGNLQLFVGKKGQASSLLYYSEKQTRFIDASIRFDGTDQWSKYSFSLGWGAPNNLLFLSELLEYQREGKDGEPRQKQLGAGQLESAILKVAEGNDIALRTVARVFRDRLRQIQVYHFHDTSDEANIRTTQDIEREDYLMSHAGNLAAFLYNLKKSKPAYFRRILSAVQIVAPLLSDFVLEPQAMNNRFVLLRWVDRCGEVFGPHQLSDGTLRAIALITALLQPEETMPSIMLFDEPELGLHPAAIELIASLLKKASEQRQVIVVTQSPLLIQNYEPEDVIVVERVEDAQRRGRTTFKRQSAEALEAWLKDNDEAQTGINALVADTKKLQPEEIDQSATTAPSKRLLRFVPAYHKRSMGPTLVQQIGLNTLLATCPHFGAWLDRLEKL